MINLRMKKIGVLILMILLVVVLCGIFYNNQYYAQRVLSAIEREDIADLEVLMKSPFGNLNCKPSLWIVEVLSERIVPTPLQAACKVGNVEIVSILLENGAKADYTHWDETRDLGSPLMIAASTKSNSRLDIMKLLVDHGADVNYEGYAGNDALSCAIYASFNGDDTIEVIEYLEQKGVDIYKKYSGTENTALHKACERDSYLVIEYLIKQRGFEINAVNADGDTPLIYFLRFASERNEQTLLLLLQAGADLNIKNKEGKTAYDYALEKHPDFIQFLK